MALRSAASSASTSSSSLRATRRRSSSRMRPVASMPTSAVMSRVSRSSRISASILRPGSSSVMSVVSQAGPTFSLARSRLKKPRTPGLSASFVIMQSLAEEPRRAGRGAACDMIRGVTFPKSPKSGARQAQFLAHRRRRLARPAGAFSRLARAAADARSGPRDPVQLAAILRRGRALPGPVRRVRRARPRGLVARRPRGGVRRRGRRGGAVAARGARAAGRHGARAGA